MATITITKMNGHLFGSMSEINGLSISYFTAIDEFALDTTPPDPPAAGQIGIFGGGNAFANYNTIDYIVISTTGNASDFGDLTAGRIIFGACSNGSYDRGVFSNGLLYPSVTYSNTIDYITITSIGNATDFGDLIGDEQEKGSTSNGVNNRGVFAGGNNAALFTNRIEYITISTPGNSTDFGDLDTPTRAYGQTSNATNNRGIICCQYSLYNSISYITISTLGNATGFGSMPVILPPFDAGTSPGATSDGEYNRGILAGVRVTGWGSPSTTNIIQYINIISTSDGMDFGDLIHIESGAYNATGCSNKTSSRGVFTVYNIMDYVTISTLGNAVEFGELSAARTSLAGTENV